MSGECTHILQDGVHQYVLEVFIGKVRMERWVKVEGEIKTEECKSHDIVKGRKYPFSFLVKK